MKLIEIKKYLKKDPPKSLSLRLHRKIGLYVTWLILLIFPKINPNIITLSMLFFNLASAIMVYYSIITENYLILIFAYIVYFISYTIDCADGNVARVTNRRSSKGVFYDRLVHNISNPTLFILTGITIFIKTNNLLFMISFIIAGIVSEFSPITVAIEHVKVSFLDQLILRKSKNFELRLHDRNEKSVTIKANSPRKIKILFEQIVRFVFSIEMLYLIILLEILIFNNRYILSFLFACVYSLGKIANSILKYDLDVFIAEIKNLDNPSNS